jgi:lactoylglutathione lyase
MFPCCSFFLSSPMSSHICISVADISACCERFESLGVSFKKKLTDGKMKNIAFALDPDGYWVEIVEQQK